jgi:hypothetical protein
MHLFLLYHFVLWFFVFLAWTDGLALAAHDVGLQAAELPRALVIEGSVAEVVYLQ